MKHIALILFLTVYLFSNKDYLSDINATDKSQLQLISFLQTKVDDRWKKESFHKFNNDIYLYYEGFSPAFQAGYYYVNLRTGAFKKIIGGHPKSVQLIQGDNSFSLFMKGESSHRNMISVVYYENQCDYNDNCKEKRIYERWESLDGGCGNADQNSYMPVGTAKMIKNESLGNGFLTLDVIEENCQSGKKKCNIISYKFNEL